LYVARSSGVLVGWSPIRRFIRLDVYDGGCDTCSALFFW
jgi:hypothetical protein